MADFITAVRSLGLTEFYMSLSVTDKVKFIEYTEYLKISPKQTLNCNPECAGCYMVSGAAEFLWAAAAKAIDKKDYSFAEPLLNYALNCVEDEQDLAWIHANLARICYHRHKLEPESGKRGIHHCRELVKMGYMKEWAQNMIDEMMLFQV